MRNEGYYQRIKELNIVHYTGEILFYSKAPLRKAEIVFLKNIKSGLKLLDLGCGSGRFSINSAKLGFDVTGVDITPEAINTCKKRAEKEKLINTTFLVGDMSELSFPDNAFDFVFCPRFSINALSTFDRRRKAINEMIRVVKPKGKIFIESFNKFYLGKGPLLVIETLSKDFLRYINIFLHKIINKEYKGLLPGDIIYKANKVLTASKGYAHLSTVFELGRMVPKEKNFDFYSIPQIIQNKKMDLVKHFRYSIWMIITK